VLERGGWVEVGNHLGMRHDLLKDRWRRPMNPENLQDLLDLVTSYSPGDGEAGGRAVTTRDPLLLAQKIE